ncbi:peptidoglycan DD-metalloendopeptidase family protein [bacterium]|nr:peptidoglycan DD-metalloendopeptidase family protein [bacterium]
MLILLSAVLLLAAEAPEKRSKQRELDELRRDISALEKQLADAGARESRLSSSLEAINEMLSLRSRLLGELQSERESTESQLKSIRKKIEEVHRDIRNADEEILRLDNEIIRMKRIVSDRIVYAYKHKRWDEFRILLTSADFNQALVRKKFFKIAAARDKRNLELLREKQNEQNELKALKLKREDDLSIADEQLEAKLNYKERLIIEAKSENTKLRKDKAEKQKLLKQVKDDQTYISKQIAEKKAAAAEIENIIKKLDEDLRQREKITYTFPDVDFPKLKGNMEWPVKGEITSRFGMQRNPKLNTWVENTGIEIEAFSGSEVRAVASGIVTVITYRRGYGTIMMISHPGRYYTVYANLDKVYVGQNSPVRGGSVIGTISGDSNKGRLHFELWAKQDKQDPEIWLKRKG